MTPQAARAERCSLDIDATHRVSALFDRPHDARALFVLAHGAGTGMEHPSLQAIAGGLAARGIATLRYQFPYRERGSRRPDPPALCHATVRAAVTEATRRAGGLPLIAGGRSFGGRMTSQSQAQSPLAQVRGLAFLGFPLHAAGQPGIERAAHLSAVNVPMLFIQGSRDALADLELLRSIVRRLGERATLHVLQDADHSFHVQARSGRRDTQVQEECLEILSAWIGRMAQPPG